MSPGDAQSPYRDIQPRSGEGSLISAARLFHHDESAMISIVTVVVVLFLAILGALGGNIALTIKQKMESQNGADSIAYSSSIVAARSMNAVTAAQHIEGELLALVALHHAFGGDELDNAGSAGSMAASDSAGAELDQAFQQAELYQGDPSPPSSDVYRRVRQLPNAGATIRASVLRLQQILASAYRAYAYGGRLQELRSVPYVGQAAYGLGVVITTAALRFEDKVSSERHLLEAIEKSARAAVPAKKAVEQLIAAIYFGYIQQVVKDYPHHVSSVVSATSRTNKVDGALFPSAEDRRLELPIEPEPQSLSSMGKSQLVRSSFPWINHWRKPILKELNQLFLLARSAYFYKHFSDQFVIYKAKKLKTDSGVNLYIIHDLKLSGSDKGNERWTRRSGSRRADELFGVVGFARRPFQQSSGFSRFRNNVPNDVVTYAQAMIYNSNPQVGSGGGQLQPEVGWDTLNWISKVPEQRDEGGKESYEPSDEPRIRVNWHAKLVPVTRLPDAARAVRAPFSTSVGRLVPDPGEFRTH
jgi:hypothetical protein